MLELKIEELGQLAQPMAYEIGLSIAEDDGLSVYDAVKTTSQPAS